MALRETAFFSFMFGLCLITDVSGVPQLPMLFTGTTWAVLGWKYGIVFFELTLVANLILQPSIMLFLFSIPDLTIIFFVEAGLFSFIVMRVVRREVNKRIHGPKPQT